MKRRALSPRDPKHRALHFRRKNGENCIGVEGETRRKKKERKQRNELAISAINFSASTGFRQAREFFFPSSTEYKLLFFMNIILIIYIFSINVIEEGRRYQHTTLFLEYIF